MILSLNVKIDGYAALDREARAKEYLNDLLIDDIAERVIQQSISGRPL